jgi:hypothetical protein
VHRHVAAERAERVAIALRLQADNHADTAEAVDDLAVNVVTDCAFRNPEALDATQRHVLADRRNGVGDRLRHGPAAEIMGAEHRVDVRRGRLVERYRNDTAHQPLEIVVSRDEIRLRVDLDDHADQILDRCADQSVGGDAAAFLGRLGEPLLAQPVDGGLDVAVRFGQRVLAVHHARAGLLTQVLHEPSRDRSHRFPSCRRAAAPGRRR